MATSMAATIAASMPAAQTAAPAIAPIYEAIPPSMSKVIDIEAEIPLSNVQLDGLVVTKIIKHSREAQPSSALGLLIGIDLDGTLEISNSFPLPHVSDEEEKSSKSLQRYQASMLLYLKEVQADDAVIGFYQSNTLGAFFKQSLVDLQATHQERLRHGGVVVVHDVAQASRGSAAFRAFRLSKAFLSAYKGNKFSTQRSARVYDLVEDIAERSLTFSSIVEEIPLRIRSNPLLGSFLSVLVEPSASHISGSSSDGAVAAALPPSFTPLDIAPVNLTHVLEALDEYKTEEGNLAYNLRQIAREKARADAYVAKRKEENVVRVSQGLAPLPEDDVSRLFKIPPEPSRLESMLLLGQIDAYSKSLADISSVGLIKMYAANAGEGV